MRNVHAECVVTFSTETLLPIIYSLNSPAASTFGFRAFENARAPRANTGLLVNAVARSFTARAERARLFPVADSTDVPLDYRLAGPLAHFTDNCPDRPNY